MTDQKIFRTLMTLDEVKSLLESSVHVPISSQNIKIEKSMGRILSEDVISSMDVPSFDRATMDGYAVNAQDTFGANEAESKVLRVVGRVEPGEVPDFMLRKGEAAETATGSSMPVGANAVLMVEYTKTENEAVEIFRSVTPGENVMSAGSDIMAGELVLRSGQVITAREVGVLAAIGRRNVKVIASPKVAIISTGNELVKPRPILSGAKICDINAYALAAAVSVSGGTPIIFGIASDNEKAILDLLNEALRVADIVLTSGSTSAGRRDLLPRIVSSMEGSKVIVNGLAMKPGKPALVAVVEGKPLFALPGNPTSALMVFHEIVKPMIRKSFGANVIANEMFAEALLAFKTFSVRGRQELLPVHVVTDEAGRYLAYPVLSGSGAITSFALADGFIKIPAERDVLSEGEKVPIHLFTSDIKFPDLVIIGSHCVGIDILLREMYRHGRQLATKIINVGSIGGLHALKRGETDLAGMHLLDKESRSYNIPFIKKFSLSNKIILFRGYDREQGFITSKGNPKEICGFEDLFRPGVTFINRNSGSGTRILIDMSLSDIAEKKKLSLEQLTGQIDGYDLEAKSHSAIASAIRQGRADVGFGIRTVAAYNGLDFVSHSFEQFDFAVNKNRISKDSVKAFLTMLRSDEFRRFLENEAPGLYPDEKTGTTISLDDASEFPSSV